MLEICDFCVEHAQTQILSGVNLSVKKGELHVLMGPNGSGKTTLVKALSGHPSYPVMKGGVTFQGMDLLALPPEDRVKEGFFTSFQHPVEIPGVGNLAFLHQIAGGGVSKLEFSLQLQRKMGAWGIETDFLKRDVNVGFSGGQKKWNELLQIYALQPKCVIFDEIDSGLDIEALQRMAKIVSEFRGLCITQVVITHSPQFLQKLCPDFVHVLCQGKIVKTSDGNSVDKLEEKGFFRCMCC